MERSEVGEHTLARSIVHWRSVILIGVSVAGGLALTSMVIGATPTVGGQVVSAPEAAVAAAGTIVDPSTTVLVDPSTTEAIPGSTDVVTDPTLPADAVPGAGPAATSSADQAAPVAWVPQSTATPTGATPSPVQQPAVPSQRAAEPTIAAPPTTAAPPAATSPAATPPAVAPTTAAPTTAVPTTAAPSPVALSYPTYTVSGASAVTLQFDGASIAVSSVSPQVNWVYQIGKNGPRTVEIKFYDTSTGTDREFHATVENGRIKVEN